MTIADEARDNAIHCEMVKYAYRQTKDGIVVSFVVHPNDIPAELSTSHIGSRFMVALVQIGDDELPVRAKEAAKIQPASPKPPVGSKRMDWRDVQPAAQAGIRCEEATFVAFLKQEHPEDWRASFENASVCVRAICGVTSRAELGTNQKARVIWHQLDTEYQAWKLVSA